MALALCPPLEKHVCHSSSYTRVSQPQHYWYLGSESPLSWGLSCAYRTLSGSILDLYPPDASSGLPSCNNQTCLQTWQISSGEQINSLLRTTGLKFSSLIKQQAFDSSPGALALNYTALNYWAHKQVTSSLPVLAHSGSPSIYLVL